VTANVAEVEVKLKLKMEESEAANSGGRRVDRIQEQIRREGMGQGK
jgi:hypothetical protein